MNREELIKAIEKGGATTIYNVIDLLNEDDPQTRNLVSSILFEMGAKISRYLKQYIELELSKSNSLKTSLFYLIDILSDHNDKTIIPLLNTMLNKCSSEEQQLFIYEAFAKLGEWDKVLPVAKEFLKDETLKDFRDLLIMIFGYIYTPESFSILSKLYDNPDFQYAKSLILDAGRKVILNVDKFDDIEKDSRLFNDIKNVS